MGIFSALLEKRSGVANPAQWLIDAVGGGKSDSGITVNEGSALRYTPVWAAVNIIAGAVGYLPLFVFKRTSEGKDRDRNNRSFNLLHDRPNPYMDALTFRETLTAHALTWGNGYAEIERDVGGIGRAVNTWPLLPNRVKVVVDETGKVGYEVRLPSGGSRILAAENVLHIKGLGFDGYQGYSVIRTHMNSLGLGIAAEKYGNKFFGNASRPSGVLEHPGKLSDPATDRLRKTWDGMHQGLENMHRLAILEEGMTWKQIGIPPEEAQFLETRTFQIGDVARIFQVPLHMLSEMSKSTFSNIEHQQIEFVTYTLLRWLKRWESEYNRKIVDPLMTGTVFAEFVVDALLRGDTASRFRSYAIGRQWGWYSVNDVRERENLNKIEGGDMYLVPSNMTPADKLGEEPEPAPEPAPDPPDDENDDDSRNMGAHFELIKETWARLQHKECDRIKRAAGRGTLKAHAKDFYEQFPTDIVNRLGPVVRSFYEALGKDPESVYLTDYLTDFAQHYARDAREALMKAPTSEDYLSTLEPDAIARRIAREVQNV